MSVSASIHLGYPTPGRCLADRLPPAPAPRRGWDRRRALLHRRERRPLPGRRRARRDRRARRLRAHPSLPPGARDLAASLLARAGGRRPRRLRRFRPRRRPAGRDRGRPHQRRRGLDRRDAGRAGARLRGRLCPLHRRGRRRSGSLGRLGDRGTRSRAGLEPLLRAALCRRRLRALRHPRPSRPGQGVGPGAARTRRRPRPLLRARGRGDRPLGGSRRALHGRPAQAGRRALPGTAVRRSVRGGGDSLRALLRRPPSRAGRLRLRSGDRAAGFDRGGEIAVFERRRRRMEPLG